MSHIYVKRENRSWDGTTDDPAAVKQFGLGPLSIVHATLDIALFDERQHLLGGYLPSGCILAVATDSGHYGPYLATADDGRGTAAGILHSSVLVRRPDDGSLKATVTVFIISSGAYIRPATLPFNSTVHPSGGYLDDAAIQTLTDAGFAFKGHTPQATPTMSTSHVATRGMAGGTSIGLAPYRLR